MSETNQVAVAVPNKTVVKFGGRGVEISTLDEGYRFAKYIVEGGFAPKGMERPEAVLVAIQMGLELGLTPMAALQGIAVINGRPGVYGDLALALVRGSGLMTDYQQTFTGNIEKGDRACTVMVQRKDSKPAEWTYTMVDAKRAGLWGKTGPWSTAPDRMLLFRARGFILRDVFGDVLKGFHTTEELSDMRTIDVTDTGTVGPARPASSYQGTALAPKQIEQTTAPVDAEGPKRISRRNKLATEAMQLGLTVKGSATADEIEAQIIEHKAKPASVPAVADTAPVVTGADMGNENDETLNSFLV